MKLQITEIYPYSSSIRKFTLASVAGIELPVAGAGAHLIIHIPGQSRVWKNAYSLIGGPAMRDRYEIIVRRIKNSRGGSAWLHDHARVGDLLQTSAPQNFFAPDRAARRHLLLSAGIGITPFLSYLKSLRAGFALHHVCKQEDAEAFAAMLPQAANITLHTSRNALRLDALLAAQPLDTQLYICGPGHFMDDVLAAAQHLGWPGSKIHRESFGSATGGVPFTVHLQKSGISIDVAADESLLDALERAGLEPPCLCRGGACGQCELPVLEGIAEHHDHFLSAARRAQNCSIMTCVSRASTPQLVLDF